MRLIDADAFKQYVQEGYETTKEMFHGKYRELVDAVTNGLLNDIDEQPTIEERKTGKWMVDPDGRLHCSRCLENPTNRVIIDGKLVYDMTPIVGKMKFCPNCGAKMEVESDGIPDDIPIEYFESGGK